MKKLLVYDLPTRIFHWLFAGLFVTAILVAKTIDDDSPIYSYHMLAGLLLSFTVLLRLVWGFIGTKYARFSSFALHPTNLIRYVKGIVRGDKRRWAGHNPASSWATVVMMIFALGLGVTGYLMAHGQKQSFEDIHELLANGFLTVAILHVAGVLRHARQHRDGITLAMMDGQKTDLDSMAGVPSSRPLTALLFVALVASFSTYLLKNYDSQNQSLQFLGSTWQLGESDKGTEGAESDKHEESESQKNESDDH
jgi:cytochrome b